MQKLKIYIIGLSSDLSNSFTERINNTVRSCRYVFCNSRFYSFLAEKVEKNKLKLFPDKLNNLPEMIKAKISDSSESATEIAIFATGDPNFYGITQFVKRHFLDADIVVIPSVSTMQEAFAKLNMNWEDAAFLSLHGRSYEKLLPFLLKNKKGFLFTTNANDVLHLFKLLKDYRLDDYTLFLVENLGTKEERITKLTYPFLVKTNISSLNVLIFVREEEVGAYPGIGLPEEDFVSKGGMITKREVRVNVISLLNLKEGDIILDIGAGSGSVSIEASFNPIGTLVFAIENDEAAFLNIKTNIKRLSANNVKPVLADFKSVSSILPTPDKIFIGGGKITENLDTAYEMLKNGGTIVIATVSFENLREVLKFAEEKGIHFYISQISSMRGEVVKGNTLMKANTPVFLVKITK